MNGAQKDRLSWTNSTANFQCFQWIIREMEFNVWTSNNNNLLNTNSITIDKVNNTILNMCGTQQFVFVWREGLLEKNIFFFNFTL